MTIEEVINAKKEMETMFLRYISIFEDESKCSIDSIQVKKVDVSTNTGGSVQITNKIKITIKI